MHRTVVEGESAHKLAPGVRDEDEACESDWEGDEAGVAPGTVFRLTKGQLRKVEGGMEQYAELAARRAARLGKSTGVE